MAIKTYIYKKVDSQELAADVYYPTTKYEKPVPIALLIHGGGFVAGGKEHAPQNQFETLLELGFVAVSVNYRLCPTISLYDGPFTDTKDCYTWCKSTLPTLLEKDTGILVDPCRVVTLGHSAGGCLAMLMGSNPDPPLAILDFYGAKYMTERKPHPDLPKVDFSEDFINQIWLDIPPPQSFKIRQSEIADPENRIDVSTPRNAWLLSAISNGTLYAEIVKDGNYARIDPVTFFSSKFPPVFFIQGTKDSLVPVQYAERAYAALKEMGVETELRLVEGEEHAFDEKLQKTDPKFAIIREGLEFLAAHAGAGK